MKVSSLRQQMKAPDPISSSAGSRSWRCCRFDEHNQTVRCCRFDERVRWPERGNLIRDAAIAFGIYQRSSDAHEVHRSCRL